MDATLAFSPGRLSSLATLLWPPGRECARRAGTVQKQQWSETHHASRLLEGSKLLHEVAVKAAATYVRLTMPTRREGKNKKMPHGS